MKKNIFIALTLLLLGSTAFAQDNKIIKREQLPDAALKYVQHNWNNISIRRALMETEGFKVEYEVSLADGTTIEFNRDGGWKEIESPKAIPESAIPAGIRSHVKQKYPGVKIVGLQKKSKGYEVKLSNNTELKFDLNGRFKSFDD